jgi:hypothetical protein
LDDLGVGREFDDFVRQRIDGGALAAIGHERRAAK